jgi:hypothetical protein
MSSPLLRALIGACVLFLLPALPALAAQADSTLMPPAFGQINGQLEAMHSLQFESQRPDVDYPSEVSVWSDRGGVRKLVVIDRDDAGDVLTEYYFEAGELVFAYQAIKGFDDSGHTRVRSEERQYFRDHAMYRWLSEVGGEQSQHDQDDPEFSDEADIRLAAADWFLSAAADIGAPASVDTVLVGGMRKRVSGTLVAADAGDIACYLSLRDDDEEDFQELADFDLCERAEELVGSRVQLSYALQAVAASDCQGDPECDQSETVALVTAMGVLDETDAAAADDDQDSLCRARETVLFACRVGAKWVSVCAADRSSATEPYLQYRFGKVDVAAAPELVLPAALLPAADAAVGEFMPFSGGGGSWLRFRNGDTSYVVYSGIGRWGPRGETTEKQGVVVESRGEKIAELPCTGALVSELGPDWYDANEVTAQDQDFEFPE